MPYVIAKVRIDDYDRFIEVFSTRGKAKREEYGCRGVTIHRVADDPNQLINIFDWDREGTEGFMADPELPGIMEAAGLQARPELTFVDRVDELEA